MLASIYGSGLILLGLWVATSLVVLALWGLLTWAVVTLLTWRRSARSGRLPPGTEVYTDAQGANSPS
jgi:hypothetical protein